MPQPELRPEQVEHAECIGNASTHGYQRVHVGSAVLQLFPGVAVKISSQPEYYGSGKNPHPVIGVRPVHEAHADHGYGHGKHQRKDSPLFQLTVFPAMCIFCYFLFLSIRFDDQVVSGILNGIF